MTNASNLIDEARLAAYLREHLPDFGDLVEMRKFAAGESNPSFLLSSGEQQYVLRRKPAGELLSSAHAIDREYRVLQALRHTAVPVPRPYLLCEDKTIIGSMFYVMSYENGDIFWDPALPEIKRTQRAAYSTALIETLAALHNVDYQAVGLGDFGRPGSYFSRQLKRWSAQYEASATESIPAMEQLIYWLHDNLPEDDGMTSLIHGDYRLDNVIFSRGQPSVLAVLDWELATLGHPLADLSYYCMGLRLPATEQIRGLGNLHRGQLGIPEEQALVALYCRQRNLRSIPHWTFCMAFSFFRLAAILQGVYRRGLDGNASSERATRMGALVAPLATLGLTETTG